MSTPEQTPMKLTDCFKIYPNEWEHPYSADELLEHIQFVFTLEHDARLYFKLNKMIGDPACVDCFMFAFDTDNGMYIEDGDMEFNKFMGQRITDSGADVVSFIKQYLRNNSLGHLIIPTRPKPPMPPSPEGYKSFA